MSSISAGVSRLHALTEEVEEVFVDVSIDAARRIVAESITAAMTIATSTRVKFRTG
jgi:hypothetical protein